MSATAESNRRLTINDITRQYADGERIAMLTAYDYPTAQILDEAGIPMILVGDSLGQVVLGYETTVRVTMPEMVHHTKAVVRGTSHALIVADMPFLSYSTPEEALDNAGIFLREAGVQAVKVEGGVRTARVIEALVRAGIPVMGHIGLTPQSINGVGKVRVQGKTRDQARALIADAFAVQEAGAFSMVLELVPQQLAAAITERLHIPTIGIGAGAGCSGQVQIITDLIGLGDFIPKHAKPYISVRGEIRDAVERLCGRRRRRHLPRARADGEDGRGDPRRGPRPRLLRPAGRFDAGGRHPARSRPLSTAPARLTRIVRTRADLRDSLRDAPRPIGLVPTMGWLHDGHRALMQVARDNDATTVVTIFVNPRQFNVADDFMQYPRNEARDLAICEAEGVDIVFAPDASEVYPPGFDTVVSVGAVARPLEGAARPGHFDGVATVVAILFDLVGAEHAYFGQKDAQQVMVIRRMARDLAISTEVIACPTVREPDGLALSSRNVHLSAGRAGSRAGAAPGPRGGSNPLGGRRAIRRRPAHDDARRAGARAARRRGLRLGRRRRDARRARADRRPGTALARGAIRRDPPHRQRADRLKPL